MSKNVAVFVDVANLYYAARGQEVDVDYVALLKAATKGRDLIRAYAYSGLDPENENQRKFIDFLTKNGYRVVHKDIRKFGDGRVKANLDIELVVDLFRLRDRMDIAVIVSGDGDFAPAIRALQDEGVRCEVISFRPNTSSDLIAVADEFIDIMKVIGIGREREKVAKGMSAPEMPAKEVVPEFGFRVASPSVAAAALAALRTGEPAARGVRGRRGGVRREEPAERAVGTAAVEPTGLAVEGEAAAAEGERRRRRRRGGRGRGRGRRVDEPAGLEGAITSEAVPEIGWQEFDALSELEGLDEDREYTFEEADEATLAELGLLDRDHAGKAPAIDEAAASHAEVDLLAGAGRRETAPRRRTARRRTVTEPVESVEAVVAPQAVDAAEAGEAAEPAAAPVAGETPAEEVGEAKPTRRRGTRRAPTAGDETEPAAKKPARRATRRRATAEAADAAEPGEATPARGRGRRRSSSAPQAEGAGNQGRAATGEGEPSGGEAEQPQGIWQRFRSARGS